MSLLGLSDAKYLIEKGKAVPVEVKTYPNVTFSIQGICIDTRKLFIDNINNLDTN